MDKHLVSVIILNWNGRAFLDDCLRSLKHQTYSNYEIILVDNGSQDDSVQLINTHYSDMLRLIQLPENRGFAGGNNVGLREARGLYIALLNNDTEADRNWLHSLVQCMNSDEKIGMVGSKVMNYYKRDEIDNTGHLIYPDGLNRGRGRLEKDFGQFETTEEILFPSGCAALYKKKMFDEIGGFDETFFAYGDDTDIGLHGRYLGYKAIFCPKAVVYHKYSGTTGSYSEKKAFFVERNRVWILVKYFSARFILLSPFYTFIRIAMQSYGMLANKGSAGIYARTTPSLQIIKTFLYSYVSALMHLPEMLVKRRRIKKRKKISIREFNNLLKSHGISCKEISLKN